MANRSGGAGGRNDLKVRVKTAKGRKLSSTRWLQRQLNDPYVRRAKQDGYRSRAAYKLLEIDDKFGFLQPGKRVVDLGAAPGGWTQLAVDRVNALGEGKKPQGTVLGVDLQVMDPIPGSELLLLDFMSDDADAIVKAALKGSADIVMSDMAAASTGHRQTDHLRIIALCETAAYFAFDVLAPHGCFIAKVLQGGAEKDLLTLLKQRFERVQHFKPPASRQDSSEKYVVASHFQSNTA